MTESSEKAEAAKRTAKEVKNKVDEAQDKLGLSKVFSDFMKNLKPGPLKNMIAIITGFFSFKLANLKEDVEQTKNEKGNETTTETKSEEEDSKEDDNESVATPEKKRETIAEYIANTAKKFIDVVNPDFRTAEVKGGVLGCAKVATTILKEAGVLNTIVPGVSSAVNLLENENNWKRVKRPPRAGDVIIWAPTGGYEKDEGGVEVAKGHRHIGIALNATRAVSNSSWKKMPIEHDIFKKRPVEIILRAPAPDELIA